jgi:cardiolipin-specific phospholipase
LLAPGAIARRPLVDRIGALKIPVTFAYGDNDWMSVDGGSEAVQKLEEAGNRDAHVYVIKNAGHHRA